MSFLDVISAIVVILGIAYAANCIRILIKLRKKEYPKEKLNDVYVYIVAIAIFCILFWLMRISKF